MGSQQPQPTVDWGMLVAVALRLSPGCRAAARGHVLLPGGPLFVCLGLDRVHRAEEPSGAPALCCLSLFLSQLLLYELGFLICVAIGVLFIILMPLVGCCFCCCRCCGNCGGRMYQKQGRRMRCRRRALCASVLLVSAFLL